MLTFLVRHYQVITLPCACNLSFAETLNRIFRKCYRTLRRTGLYKRLGEAILLLVKKQLNLINICQYIYIPLLFPLERKIHWSGCCEAELEANSYRIAKKGQSRKSLMALPSTPGYAWPSAWPFDRSTNGGRKVDKQVVMYRQSQLWIFCI